MRAESHNEAQSVLVSTLALPHGKRRLEEEIIVVEEENVANEPHEDGKGGDCPVNPEAGRRRKEADKDKDDEEREDHLLAGVEHGGWGVGVLDAAGS
jgi:hypothetical protein